MILVNNLSFRYTDNSPYILRDLSFVLDDGEILSILGKNGIGKTTFLKCLTAELTDYTGEIMIEQQEVRSFGIPELSEKVALVATNSPIYQNLMVADYLTTGFANRLAALQSPSRLQYEQAFDVLCDLGQGELFNRYIHELSSGELQIIKIARAIIQRPRIIIFDEPTANLDIKNQLLVLEQITGLSDKGFTVITTTHNPGQVIELGGKTLLLTEDDQIFGAVDDLLTEDNLRRVYDLHATIEDGRYRKYVSFFAREDGQRLIY